MSVKLTTNEKYILVPTTDALYYKVILKRRTTWTDKLP